MSFSLVFFFSSDGGKSEEVVKVKLLVGAAKLPTRATPGAAGYDLHAAESVLLQPRSTVAVRTGVALEMSRNVFAFAVGRSGLALDRSITVHTGTIDPDFRGEVKLILHNLSPVNGHRIGVSDRIGQLIFLPLSTPRLLLTDRLEETLRGERGFGSTGTN